MSDLAHYFVSDIETNGPNPLLHSMLSFATVVVREDGEFVGEFKAAMEPRDGYAEDEATMRWWRTQPEAWAAATTNTEKPDVAMMRFKRWVEEFPGIRSFAARPLLFDGLWMDRYLRDFADCYVLDIPYWGNAIFTGGALDIGTYISGVFGRTHPHTIDDKIPSEWLGEFEHTHRAIDDARGYAHLVSKLLNVAREREPHPDDFLEGLGK